MTLEDIVHPHVVGTCGSLLDDGDHVTVAVEVKKKLEEANVGIHNFTNRRGNSRGLTLNTFCF